MEVRNGELNSSVSSMKVWLRRLNVPVIIALVIWGIGAIYYVATTGEIRLIIYPILASGAWIAVRKKADGNYGREEVVQQLPSGENLLEEHRMSRKNRGSASAIIFRMTDQRILVSPASHPDEIEVDIPLNDVDSMRPARNFGIIDNVLQVKAGATTYSFIAFKSQRTRIIERFEALTGKTTARR